MASTKTKAKKTKPENDTKSPPTAEGGAEDQGLLSKIGDFFKAKPEKKKSNQKEIKPPYRYTEVLNQFHNSYENLKKIRDTVLNFTREMHSSAIPNDAALISFSAIGDEQPGENLNQRIAPFISGLRQKGLYSPVDLESKQQAAINRFWLSITHVIPSLINPIELINMLLNQTSISAGDTILAPSTIQEIWGRRLRIQIYCPTSISILLIRPDKIFGNRDTIVTLDQHLATRQVKNQINPTGYFLVEFEIPCEKGSILIAGTNVQDNNRLSKHVISVSTK
ncbi:MAG: hypothetical protein QM523_02500 [Candidatus Pacebacteria bacterium]|nr:hypothetical protein [Candidatus Paceibacterota bacterium]